VCVCVCHVCHSLLTLLLGGTSSCSDAVWKEGQNFKHLCVVRLLQGCLVIPQTRGTWCVCAHEYHCACYDCH